MKRMRFSVNPRLIKYQHFMPNRVKQTKWLGLFVHSSLFACTSHPPPQLLIPNNDAFIQKKDNEKNPSSAPWGTVTLKVT